MRCRRSARLVQSGVTPIVADTVIDPPAAVAASAGRQRTAPAVFKHRLVRFGAGIVISLALLALAAPTLTRLGVLREPIQQDQKGLDDDGMPHRAVASSRPSAPVRTIGAREVRT